MTDLIKSQNQELASSDPEIIAEKLRNIISSIKTKNENFGSRKGSNNTERSKRSYNYVEEELENKLMDIKHNH